MTKSICAACGAVFASVSAFDRHRTGDYAPRQSSEKARQTPSGKPHQKRSRQRHIAHTRRCLSAQEMQARGMAQNARGWWVTDVRAFPVEVFEPIKQTAAAGAA